MQADAGPSRRNCRPHTALCRIWAIFLLLLLVPAVLPVAAHADSAPVAASTAAPRLTPQQAQQLLGVLDDDEKRKQFVTTLRNLSVAQGAAPAPAAAPPLRDDSLGGQIIGSFHTIGHATWREVHSLSQTIGNFRSLGPWVRHVGASPDLRNEMAKILLRVALMTVIATALAFLMRAALTKPRKALEATARARNYREQIAENQDADDARQAADRAVRQAETDSRTGDPADAAAEDQAEALQREATDTPQVDPYQAVAAESEHLARVESEQNERLKHQGALAKLVMALRRLPYALGCFVLDLIPVAMFPLTAFLIGALDTSGDQPSMDALQGVAWIANVAVGVWIAILAALLAPGKPWLRLTTFGNGVSDFLYRWLRRVGIVLGWGIAALVVLGACTMPDSILSALGKLLALSVHIMLAIMILNARGYVARGLEGATTDGRFSVVARVFVRVWWIVALFFDLGLWLVWAAEIHGGYAAITALFVRTSLALVVMRIVAIAAYGGLERLFRFVGEWESIDTDSQERIARYYPAARRVLSVVIVLLTLLALSVVWGMPVHAMFGQGGIGSRLVSSVVTIIVALLIGVAIWEAVNIAIERHIRRLGTHADSKARTARFRTLQPMFRILLMVVLVGVIGLTVLSEIGVNTAPLLASASIFGVALGFGSQKLVQDFISGIFLLLENALTVGDAVTLSGTYGVVEKLSLRTVHVRANDGSMNIFPFSSLGQIINFNRDFGRAIIIAEVGYSVDTDDVVKALHDITAEMREDEKFRELIIDNFQMWGVDALNDSSVTVRGTLPTVVGGRWPVQREFYRRMKKCFQARGIDIPFPTRTLDITGLERLMDYRGGTRADWIEKSDGSRDDGKGNGVGNDRENDRGRSDGESNRPRVDPLSGETPPGNEAGPPS